MTTTRFGSVVVCRNDVTAPSEYSTDCPYAAATRRGSPQTCAAVSPWAGMGSKTEPSPTLPHGTCEGNGAQGEWLEVRSSSAITGRRGPGVSSRRCRAASTYWSGIVE